MGSARKGWCPGALRPMAAADGLIVRLRLTGGILAPATARALADLADRHGNGRLDLTSRASLQMRGVREAARPALVAALRDLGLVDADAATEAVRNVIASPLAGLRARLDIRPLVAALEARLATTPALHALPAKFGFLVDDGSAPSLAAVPADVRFDWTGAAFAVAVAGTRSEAVSIGACEADDLVDRAEAIARVALALFAQVPEARRMRDLVGAVGAGAVARACGAAIAGEAPSSALRAPSPARGEGRSRQGSADLDDTLALAPPYGRLDSGMLRLAADLAGTGELRLTPWRSVLLPHPAVDAREKARGAGFIVDPDDPRLAIAACVGLPDCAWATTTTRRDADALADAVAGLAAAAPGSGPRLHVSGCAKGCARAAPAPVTLVGRDGRYDLVVEGRAGDPPVRRGLDLAAARVALAALQPA